MTNSKAKFKEGQKVKCNIRYAGERFTATIIGIDTHKGRRVYDLDNDRFVYEDQIISVVN